MTSRTPALAQCGSCDCVLILMAERKKREKEICDWSGIYEAFPGLRGPASSLICFYSADPSTPGGSHYRTPPPNPNGLSGRQPISRCLFSNQITVFKGDTRVQSQVQTDICLKSFPSQLFHAVVLPIHPPQPTPPSGS